MTKKELILMIARRITNRNLPQRLVKKISQSRTKEELLENLDELEIWGDRVIDKFYASNEIRIWVEKNAGK